ncbi:MAG: type IX secretion system sortase PorU [Flavobacteriales bacterium]|nr:type IX secretion system sortase PorU [Flavobacteriales bacterium]
MKYFNYTLLILLITPCLLFSQTILVEGEIKWKENAVSKIDALNSRSFLAFDNVSYDSEKDFLGFYVKQIKLNQEKIIGLNILNIGYEDVDENTLKGTSGFEYIKNDIDLQFVNGISKKINYGQVMFTPIVYNTEKNTYQRVVSYSIEVNVQNMYSKKSGNKVYSANSVLQSGDWYKIAVLKDGGFKLSYQFLKNLGMDIDNLNPQDFKLYGNGGKMLPALNSDFRVDDLQQNAIHLDGENDGSFDVDDYVLFYGQSPHTWKLNSLGGFDHDLHKYSDTTYYFITFSNTGEPVKRITSQASSLISNQTVTSFNDYAYYEKDVVNLISSGDKWFGEFFDVKTAYDFVFNFPNIDFSTPIDIKFSCAARSSAGSVFNVVSGGGFLNLSVSAVNTTSFTARFAQLNKGSFSVNPSSDLVTVSVNYNKPNPGAIGWLDEIELNARRNLVMFGNQLFFRDVQSVGVGNVSIFTLGNATGVNQLWEITDPYNIKSQQYNLLGSTLTYSLSTDSLRSFVALTTNYESQIIGLGKVINQNLHSISQVDMIIVSHPNFLTQAKQVAQFHIDNDGLNVVVTTPEQVYNEFSSGSQDVIAIREFVKMMYERTVPSGDELKYLLLFGDGSFDNKNRVVGNTNFIPTYQTPNSIDIIGSLVSDDYYGLLDPSEGTFLQPAGQELIDIAIGRFPVKSQEEANNVVNKILNYNVPTSMNEWRNRITFIGDDEDNATHMKQSNSLSGQVEMSHKDYNVNKIFFDAFTQQSTPGGTRYPDVNDAINESVESGSLIVNYTGHGGEAGWGHERVLTIADINSWTNTSGFPLFITATCEFSRFDDPHRTTAGELVLVGEYGGIGLLTTVRLVFSGPNFALNQDVYDEIFQITNNNYPTMGEVFMNVKNLNATNSNNRNFTLLGDPALRLAYPIHDVITTQINGNNVSSNDTIKALSKVIVSGEVRDILGNKLTNYNGVIYPIVFDKEKQITTLSNDGEAPFSFNLQTSKLFKGKVSVINGDFSYTFVVPKDISYNFGKGKLSYYAENQIKDANGYHTEFYIGGTASNYEVDEVGPEIELFMNDEKFVFGGITDENPILLANISDIHGVNTVGNGIGHDIIAVLDDKTEESFILNDFYEADLNSYQKGKVYFPFTELEEGRHKLTLKVWDVYNNSSEATIEFVVVKSKDITLERVYNYPNPFTTYTEFWFEHNQPGKQLFAQVQVFTVSGKLVKTLEKHILNEGFRSTSITWNGLDEYGDRIGKGVYVYRLKVRTENFSVAEKYEKLVILR